MGVGCECMCGIGTDIPTIGPSSMHGTSHWIWRLLMSVQTCPWDLPDDRSHPLAWNTTFSILLGLNALKCPVQGRTSPAIPWKTPGMEQHCWVPSCCSERIHLDGIDTAKLSVGILSSSATSGHPSGCSKQVLVWGSWTLAKTSQPLTHLRGVRTFNFVLHAGSCMWNHKKKELPVLGGHRKCVCLGVVSHPLLSL